MKLFIELPDVLQYSTLQYLQIDEIILLIQTNQISDLSWGKWQRLLDLWYYSDVEQNKKFEGALVLPPDYFQKEKKTDKNIDAVVKLLIEKGKISPGSEKFLSYTKCFDKLKPTQKHLHSYFIFSSLNRLKNVKNYADKTEFFFDLICEKNLESLSEQELQSVVLFCSQNFDCSQLVLKNKESKKYKESSDNFLLNCLENNLFSLFFPLLPEKEKGCFPFALFLHQNIPEMYVFKEEKDFLVRREREASSCYHKRLQVASEKLKMIFELFSDDQEYFYFLHWLLIGDKIKEFNEIQKNKEIYSQLPQLIETVKKEIQELKDVEREIKEMYENFGFPGISRFAFFREPIDRFEIKLAFDIESFTDGDQVFPRYISETDQVVGRAIRMQSHQDFKSSDDFFTFEDPDGYDKVIVNEASAFTTLSLLIGENEVLFKKVFCHFKNKIPQKEILKMCLLRNKLKLYLWVQDC